MDTLAALAAAQTKGDKGNDGDESKTMKKPKKKGESASLTDSDAKLKTKDKKAEERKGGNHSNNQNGTKYEDVDADVEEEEHIGEEDSTMNETVDSGEASAVAPVVSSGGKVVTAVKVKKTPTKRRKKSKKPTGYPKRPLSAYNLFFKTTREKIITEHGKTNFQEMVRLIASHWRDVSDEEKKKYEDLAAKDLVRYKKEVSAYEKDTAEKKRVEQERQALLNEKNREQERKLVEAMKKKSAEGAAGVRLVNGRFEEDGEVAGAPGIGARLPYGMGREEAMIAAMGGSSAAAGGRDLEMARLRLEQDLRGLEEARVLRLRQLELAHMQGGGGGLGGLRGPAGMYGGDHNLEFELQRRYLAANGGGGGGDHLGMSNEHELRQRLAEEQLLRESNFGASLGLGGRFGAYSSALGMGGQSMGLSNPYEEILLREQMLRRERELLLGGGGGGGASLYGGGLGAAGLGSLGLGGASAGLWGANAAVADADMHTNAAAAGLASLRGQSSYVPGSHLERLSDEELRALSTGRGFDVLSNRASAFKRVDAEMAKDGMKGE
ncbi:HMG high mobility group box-containing protein [Nitzschia inconspicua]|uniref:HMG high mobility group box-containing protein n=1 Tax=Nitzschia inconspicua TaxID=303405 RepID=A0A9K3L6P6_9STRA|nr:HMG high mobility group box-containing protein [Nitzschia inconspicua]